MMMLMTITMMVSQLPSYTVPQNPWGNTVPYNYSVTCDSKFLCIFDSIYNITQILSLHSKLACQTSPPATLLPPIWYCKWKISLHKTTKPGWNFQFGQQSAYFFSQRIPVTVKFLWGKIQDVYFPTANGFTSVAEPLLFWRSPSWALAVPGSWKKN